MKEWFIVIEPDEGGWFPSFASYCFIFSGSDGFWINDFSPDVEWMQ